MNEDRKANFVVTKLKGNTSLWWDGVHAERKRKNKEKIKSWDQMIVKLRGKFLPQYYQHSLFIQMQNLRQRLMFVREYTEEFYRVNIRAGYVQDIVGKVSKYMNGLRMDIQDEIILLTPRTVEEAYHLSLKEEEKIVRRKYNRGRGPNIARGQQFNRGRSTTQREGTSSSSHQGYREDDFKERGFSPRGRGWGRGREFKCYKCGKMVY